MGKTFSTFPPLLSLSSQDETSRIRLPEGSICCLNWPDLHNGYFWAFSLKIFCVLASCLQVGARDLTRWSWSLVPQFLIHLDEFKGHLLKLGSMSLVVVCTCWPSKSSRVNCSFQIIEEQLQFSVFPLNSSSTLGEERKLGIVLLLPSP